MSAPKPVANKVTATLESVKELTIRSVIIGGIITLIFTAANVYLGLKVGLTFATSIPAAVISMAILRFFADHTVVENNIVQTIASAAGTLSAIIFVLPGLVMIGWWQGFPYWTTMAICLVGGILGVMYSIPLRRALVTGSNLPFPEGVAGAEVLKVGDTEGADEDNQRGLKVIIAGGLGSVGMSLLGAMKVLGSEVSTAFRIGSGGTMLGTSLSLALIGIGHLVGISVGIAMIVGLSISYFILLPWRSSGMLEGASGGDLADKVGAIFAGDVRFIGAGAIAIAAVWTLIKIIGPIMVGIKEAIQSTRQRHTGHTVPRTERDIPINVVAIVILVCMVPIGLLLWQFVQGTPVAHNTAALITISVAFTLLIGLVVAAVCGYMAGLIGSSNSPISGVGILVVLTCALLVKLIHGTVTADETNALVAYTLFTSAIVFGVATISNDNLQDLKTGELVQSTPWKQQVALVIGVFFGSLIIPPVLELMTQAFGFVGAPGAGKNALAAPQAGLISSLAKGVFGGDLDWGLIGLGALIGCGVIVIDELLKQFTRFSLPPLAVGMGMYLPASLTIMIPVGAVLGTFYDRWSAKSKNPERSRRMGILLATGLIVGESLFGVVFAGIVAASGNETPLAVVGDGFATVATWLGVLAFIGIIAAMYRYTVGTVKRADAPQP